MLDQIILKESAESFARAAELESSGGKLLAELNEQRNNPASIAKAPSAAEAGANGGDYPEAYTIIPPRILKEMQEQSAQHLHARQFDESPFQIGTSQLFRPRAEAPDSKGARDVYDLQQNYDLPGTLARSEGSAPTNVREVDDAYDFTGTVRDFYQKEFGRNSIDGKGAKFLSTVNYGEDYSGAFWNGSEMVYGHPGKYSAYTTMMKIDICGHEITHGVTEKENAMRYYGQSGALNESISDVFGSLIKQYSLHQTADKADWLIGAGIWKPEFNGRALRDLLHPGTAFNDPHRYGKDPQPDNMRGYIVEKEDNGGVHDNSGIPNRAFAEFALAVGGFAWEIPGHIWYNARNAAGREPSFGQFAYYTVEEAKKLNRPDLVEKLENAWKTVGVTPSKTDTDNLTPPQI